MDESSHQRRCVVTGATGLLGSSLCDELRRRDFEVFSTSRSGGRGSAGVDLAVAGAIGAFLDATSPDVVFHLGAISRPAQVLVDREIASQVNLSATEEVAAWCAENRRQLLFTSTDHVYDGERGPYRERDLASPATYYGALKLAAEKSAIEANGLVARLGWILNDCSIGRPDFVREALGRMRMGQRVKAVGDEFRTPIQLSEAVRLLCDLADWHWAGIVNMAGRRHVTPYDLLVDMATRHNLSPDLVQIDTRHNLLPVGRPRDLRLNTDCLASIMSERASVSR